MKKKSKEKTSIQKIADALPDSLSEQGLEQISELLEEEVDFRLAEAKKAMSASVNSVIQTRLEDLKEVALEELLAENENVRMIDGFNKVLEIMVEYADKATLGSVLKEKDELIEKLQRDVKTLNRQLTNTVNENTRLEKKSKVLKESLEQSSRDLEDAQAALNEDFESSEKAVVISEDILKRIRSENGEKNKEEKYNYTSENDNELITEDLIRTTLKVLVD